MSGREMPQDFAAEQAVLGGMLLSRMAVAEVSGIVTARDFYQPKHEQIFDAATTLFAHGEPVDTVTVANELGRRGELTRAGGPPYLHACIQTVPSAASAGYYAQIVRECAVLRAVAEVGTRITQMAFETDRDDADAIVARAQKEVFALGRDHAQSEGGSLGETLGRVLDDVECGSSPGLKTGYADFDQLTGGLKPGQLMLIAARPAVGKSTALLDIHRRVSIRDGGHSILFSLEMGRDELATRLLAAEARVPLHHLRHGSMTEEDWERARKRLGSITAAPLEIVDDVFTIEQIAARAREYAAEHPLRLVGIDYLQLAKRAAGGRRAESRQVEVSEISRDVKLLAKELDVPVIGLSQLNRGPEQRTDKRPILSDLRESGSLEQDADIVVLLHREDAYERESPRAGEADFIVAKHRGGPKATITVAHQGHYSRFVDMADEQPPWSPSAATGGPR